METSTNTTPTEQKEMMTKLANPNTYNTTPTEGYDQTQEQWFDSTTKEELEAAAIAAKTKPNGWLGYFGRGGNRKNLELPPHLMSHRW